MVLKPRLSYFRDSLIFEAVLLSKQTLSTVLIHFAIQVKPYLRLPLDGYYNRKWLAQ